MSKGKEIVVLCYGDSNTHGTKPDGSEDRYSRNVRWTGQLQKKLGSNYYVIEEGLGGRTTNLEHPKTEKPMRNGWAYFRACLESHSPVDIIIIMLGTNDLKNVYHRSAKETAEVLRKYCQYISSASPNAKIILVAPALLKATEPVEYYDSGSEQKSKDLVLEIEKAAKDQGAIFYNANETVKVGEDGLHWTDDSESSFSAALASAVEKLK